MLHLDVIHSNWAQSDNMHSTRVYVVISIVKCSQILLRLDILHKKTLGKVSSAVWWNEVRLGRGISQNTKVWTYNKTLALDAMPESGELLCMSHESCKPSTSNYAAKKHEQEREILPRFIFLQRQNIERLTSARNCNIKLYIIKVSPYSKSDMTSRCDVRQHHRCLWCISSNDNIEETSYHDAVTRIGPLLFIE